MTYRKLHIINVFAVAVVIILSSSTLAGMSLDSLQRIDTTLIRAVDFTGDGNPDTVLFHVQGNNILSPFQWELSIRANDSIIFSAGADDSSNDEVFSDTGFIGNCRNYQECKSAWYFRDFLNLLIVPESFVPAYVDSFAIEFLKDSCAVNDSEAIAILNWAEAKIKNENVRFLNFVPTPVTMGPIWMYIPRVKRFIPVWEE